MKKRINITAIFTLCLSLVFFSCKTKEKSTTHNPLRVSDKEVIKNYYANNFNFNTISGKAALSLKEDDKKTDFKITFRIKKDSIIWVSITPMLGIEAARVLITQDSVMMLDRLHKTYYKNDISHINDLFDIDVDFELIQNLLLANPISIEPENKRDKIYVKRNRKEGLFYVSNAKKRKLRKAINKDKNKFKETVETIFIYPEIFKMARVIINDFQAHKTFETHYTEYQTVEEQQFPKTMHFKIANQKIINLDIKYTKVNVNKNLRFSFHIPSKYERIN